jgi:hypothetical protein
MVLSRASGSIKRALPRMGLVAAAQHGFILQIIHPSAHYFFALNKVAKYYSNPEMHMQFQMTRAAVCSCGLELSVPP